MRNNDNPDIKLLSEELNEKRDALRKKARESILRIQEKDRKSFNKGRVLDSIYDILELVAIKHT